MSDEEHAGGAFFDIHKSEHFLSTIYRLSKIVPYVLSKHEPRVLEMCTFSAVEGERSKYEATRQLEAHEIEMLGLNNPVTHHEARMELYNVPKEFDDIVKKNPSKNIVMPYHRVNHKQRSGNRTTPSHGRSPEHLKLAATTNYECTPKHSRISTMSNEWEPNWSSDTAIPNHDYKSKRSSDTSTADCKWTPKSEQSRKEGRTLNHRWRPEWSVNTATPHHKWRRKQSRNKGTPNHDCGPKQSRNIVTPDQEWTPKQSRNTGILNHDWRLNHFSSTSTPHHEWRSKQSRSIEWKPVDTKTTDDLLDDFLNPVVTDEDDDMGDFIVNEVDIQEDEILYIGNASFSKAKSKGDFQRTSSNKSMKTAAMGADANSIQGYAVESNTTPTSVNSMASQKPANRTLCRGKNPNLPMKSDTASIRRHAFDSNNLSKPIAGQEWRAKQFRNSTPNHDRGPKPSSNITAPDQEWTPKQSRNTGISKRDWGANHFSSTSTLCHKWRPKQSRSIEWKSMDSKTTDDLLDDFLNPVVTDDDDDMGDFIVKEVDIQEDEILYIGDASLSKMASIGGLHLKSMNTAAIRANAVYSNTTPTSETAVESSSTNMHGSAIESNTTPPSATDNADRKPAGRTMYGRNKNGVRLKSEVWSHAMGSKSIMHLAGNKSKYHSMKRSCSNIGVSVCGEELISNQGTTSLLSGIFSHPTQDNSSPILTKVNSKVKKSSDKFIGKSSLRRRKANKCVKSLGTEKKKALHMHDGDSSRTDVDTSSKMKQSGYPGSDCQRRTRSSDKIVTSFSTESCIKIEGGDTQVLIGKPLRTAANRRSTRKIVTSVSTDSCSKTEESNKQVLIGKPQTRAANRRSTTKMTPVSTESFVKIKDSNKRISPVKPLTTPANRRSTRKKAPFSSESCLKLKDCNKQVSAGKPQTTTAIRRSSRKRTRTRSKDTDNDSKNSAATVKSSQCTSPNTRKLQNKSFHALSPDVAVGRQTHHRAKKMAKIDHSACRAVIMLRKI